MIKNKNKLVEVKLKRCKRGLMAIEKYDDGTIKRIRIKSLVDYILGRGCSI
jgi:hypothetical protein